MLRTDTESAPRMQTVRNDCLPETSALRARGKKNLSQHSCHTVLPNSRPHLKSTARSLTFARRGQSGEEKEKFLCQNTSLFLGVHFENLQPRDIFTSVWNRILFSAQRKLASMYELTNVHLQKLIVGASHFVR